MSRVKDIIKARTILEHIIQGREPLTGIEVSRESFLDSPELIRSLSQVVSTLTHLLEDSSYRPKDTRKEFDITPEQLAQVKFPQDKIGVTIAAKCINAAIDTSQIKEITGVKINARLKEQGILGEKIDDSGKKSTITNATSHRYGIETIKSSFNGQEYEKIVFNDKGKRLLLENFIKFMKLEEAAAIKSE